MLFLNWLSNLNIVNLLTRVTIFIFNAKYHLLISACILRVKFTLLEGASKPPMFIPMISFTPIF